jgi:MinD-like ATPase involved in chromosome partitioning or flagellar assembly
LAVANIGSILADSVRPSGGRVLLVDFDLEAPGLNVFFAEGIPPAQRNGPGVVEYFGGLANRFASAPARYAEVLENRPAIDTLLSLDSFIQADVLPGLDLMPSNPGGSEYRRRVAEFDWSMFWLKYPAAIHAFRESLERRYRFVLIDSRTGYGDVSGLCSAILPEKLVIVVSLNRQNLEGAIDIARRSVRFREKSDDIRPLAIYPLAGRVDTESEVKEHENWLRQFEEAFEVCFREIYGDPECRLENYFDNYFIPYSRYYSYGEKLVRLHEESSRPGSIRRAYEDFSRLLARSEYPWQPESEWPPEQRVLPITAHAQVIPPTPRQE